MLIFERTSRAKGRLRGEQRTGEQVIWRFRSNNVNRRETEWQVDRQGHRINFGVPCWLTEFHWNRWNKKESRTSTDSIRKNKRTVELADRFLLSLYARELRIFRSMKYRSSDEFERRRMIDRSIVKKICNRINEDKTNLGEAFYLKIHYRGKQSAFYCEAPEVLGSSK